MGDLPWSAPPLFMSSLLSSCFALGFSVRWYPYFASFTGFRFKIYAPKETNEDWTATRKWSEQIQLLCILFLSFIFLDIWQFFSGCLSPEMWRTRPDLSVCGYLSVSEASYLRRCETVCHLLSSCAHWGTILLLSPCKIAKNEIKFAFLSAL